MGKRDVHKALLLCASHNDLGLIRSLRKLGYYIIVTGNLPGLPGERWCDEYIQADYSDKELVLDIASKRQVQAIVQCCNDFGVYTASYVAEKLGLPGYDSYEKTCILHNKDKFKIFAREHGIATPLAESFSDSTSALAWMQEADYPLIVKPTDASAGNGIMRVEDFSEAAMAVETAFHKSRAGRIVVEPYVVGTQHGLCTFLINHKVAAVCSNDEFSFLNPYRVEIDLFPACNYDDTHTFLIKQIEKIAEVMQLSDGIFHLQYIYDGEQPHILEVMRRVLGNMYHVPGNALTGFDWEYWETRARCGLPLTMFPKQGMQEGCFAYKTILARRNGIIRSIDLPDSYKKYVYDYILLKKAGDEVTKYQSEPVGFLFLMFPSPEKMRRVLIDEYRDDLVTLEGAG